MFAIESIPKHELQGVDPSDARWTRLIHKYVSPEAADLEVGWLELEDDGQYAYRVVSIQGETQ